MTVFAKDMTYGLESKVLLLQNHLSKKLIYDVSSNPSGWQGEVEIYGLIYKIESDKGILPEAYKGTGSKNMEYKQVFVNDKVSATIGFLETGNRTLGNPKKTNLDMICTVRLDKIYASNLRNDELAFLQTENALNSFPGFRVINNSPALKQGVNNVFSGFYTDNIKNRDMHPWLTFAFNFDLLYQDDNTYC